MCVYISLCTTVVHNTAQNSSDYFPCQPPDNHHSSDAVYWRGGHCLSLKSCDYVPLFSENFILKITSNGQTRVNTVIYSAVLMDVRVGAPHCFQIPSAPPRYVVL